MNEKPFSRKVKYVDKTGKERDLDWVTRPKPTAASKWPNPKQGQTPLRAQPPQESKAQQIVHQLLDD